ncbi:hypothetical protein Dimus_001443, partial [Dionaea muscipula]
VLDEHLFAGCSAPADPSQNVEEINSESGIGKRLVGRPLEGCRAPDGIGRVPGSKQ